MNTFKSEEETEVYYEICLQRNARLTRFVKTLWPAMMEAEPPKTEPVESPEIVALRDSWRNELPMVNPYVPLAHRSGS